MWDSLVLTLIWTFNIALLVLVTRADVLRRVVLRSWEILFLLVALELVWSGWTLYTGQAPLVVMAALWLGVNLLITVNLARRYARVMTSTQVAMLCSWWLALLGMALSALHQSGLA